MAEQGELTNERTRSFEELMAEPVAPLSSIARQRYLDLENSRVHQISAVFLLLGSYLALIWITGPMYGARRHAFFVHLLFLLGLGVVLFGVWDFLALRALRRILHRDRSHLVASVNESGLCFDERSAELAGGLAQAATRQYLALGNYSPRFLALAMRDALGSVRFGTGFMSYAFAAAPLLGLLGTLLGLKATFESPSLIASGSLQIDLAMPYLGLAMITTMLGLIVSLVSLLFWGLVNPALARDCQRLAGPIVEVITLRAEQPAGDPQTPSDLLYSPRTCSRELTRTRIVSGVIALSLASALALAIALPGGIGDVLFTRTVTAETATPGTGFVTELFSQSNEPPPQPEEEPKATESASHQIEVEFGELLENYQQAVVAAYAESLILAFLKYRENEPSEADVLGQALLARTYEDIKPAIAGFVDLTTSEFERRQLNLQLPRLIARIDCVVRGQRLAVLPVVTFGVLDGSSAPIVLAAPYSEFQAFREENRYPYQWGQILDRNRILDLLPSHAVRSFRDRASTAWNQYGRAAEDGEEHLVMWMLFEPEAKISNAIKSFESLKLQGSVGDYIAFRWAAVDGSTEIELRGAEFISPPELEQVLQEKADMSWLKN